MWACSMNSEWGRATELAIALFMVLLDAKDLALAFDLALALGAALGGAETKTLPMLASPLRAVRVEVGLARKGVGQLPTGEPSTGIRRG